MSLAKDIKYKLNIIEPWESGTDSAIDTFIVNEKGEHFLLFVEKTIRVRGDDAHYFICKLQDEDDKTAFKKRVKKMYPIHMIFDKNIKSEQQEISDISSYRANFLSGEIIIS